MVLPRILEPLKIRDFALLWSGQTISRIGDRFFTVAMAWETYSLSNKPIALGLVAACSTAPFVIFVVFGGVLSDRIERRRMMIASDVIRAASIGAIGALALTGRLQLWELAALVAVAGFGSALFGPAFGSIVPEIVPRELLPQANALEQFVRPAVGLVGPSLGGVVVATAGAGWAFVADAASFGASTIALLLLSARPRSRPRAESWRHEVAEGFRFVRNTPWLSGGLVSSLPLNVAVSAGIVLLPFLVKNELHASARSLGLVFSAGAVGGLVGSFALGQRGLPRRHVLVAYVGWTVSVGCTGLYGIATHVPELTVLAAVGGFGSAYGQAIWGTMMHTIVPNDMLGRVYSLDMLTAAGILPVANLAVGGIASAVGVRPTLVGAGAFSAAVTIAFVFFWPRMRESEVDGSMLRSAVLE